MKELFKKIIYWKLRIIAKLILRKYKPKIITVTGSVGKTSAKDAIYTAISHSLYAAKSQKSYNSEIGIPLAIIGVDSGWGNFFLWFKNILEGLFLLLLPNHYPKWLVLEAGVDHPGDMDSLTKLLKSNVVVFTRFAQTPVHVEFFDSPEEVMKEKLKLVKSLTGDGILILNSDDEDVLKIRDGSGKHAITYGFNEDAQVRANNLEISYEDNIPTGIDFKIDIDGNTLPISLKGVLGIQHVYPILSALAVSKALNLNEVKTIEAFRDYESAPGRMRILRGVNDSTLIDDSYNSSPVAVKEALNVLLEIKAKRKIAVLGDMMELGKYMEEEHRKIGLDVLSKVDTLITVGERAKFIAEEAGFNKENIFQFNNSVEAGDFLKDYLKGGDVVLLKGSQYIRLEKAVKKVLMRVADSHLLVRQEKVWDNK